MSGEFAMTFFTDYAAQQKRQRSVTLAELATLIRDTAAPAKDRLPWLKLARFGNAATSRGSLRHDKNLIAITGIEGDYDAEQIGFDAAIETAEKAGLRAIVYTSPSYTPERPRWRILAPTSREYRAADRARLLGRLNGLYRGIFARESWTLSQAYYFGRVGSGFAHQVETVAGEPIDRLDELDRIWLGPPASPAGRRTFGEVGAEARGDAELVRRIITGDGFHPELTALAARYVGRGMDPRAVADVLRGMMLSHPADTHDDRWRDRIASIPAIVRSAAEKFAAEADRRRAVARVTHRAVRRRSNGEEIKAAVLAEASRVGLDAGSALTIGGAVLRDFERRYARRR